MFGTYQVNRKLDLFFNIENGFSFQPIDEHLRTLNGSFYHNFFDEYDKCTKISLFSCLIVDSKLTRELIARYFYYNFL